jgi:hypothetical protein
MVFDATSFGEWLFLFPVTELIDWSEEARKKEREKREEKKKKKPYSPPFQVKHCARNAEKHAILCC